MKPLDIRLLGPLRVTCGANATVDLKYDKVRALLAYLAVESDRAHRREQLATLLWPDLDATASRNNLRQALHTLRQVIDGDGEHLITTRATVQFNTEAPHALDVATFNAALDFAHRHPHRNPYSCHTCATRLQQAVDLYSGPFLADLALPDSTTFQEWAILQREYLERRLLDALQRLLAFHQRRGDYDRAAAMAQRQLQIEPWRERAYRALMRLHVLRDRRPAALSQYEKCRAILRQELDVEPEDRTTALYHEIAGAGDDLPAHLIPESTAAPFHVPLPPTPFIGREEEVERLAALLDGAGSRLITVTGPGGVGKTRLALQAAADQISLFAGGIYFINLLPLQRADRLPQLIAAAVDLDLHPPADNDYLTAATLAHALQDMECLLILDNFDHLVDGAAILQPLLRRAPAVKLLITSRHRLHLQDEWLLPLTGLQLPENDDESLPVNAALQLFTSSARRSGVEIPLTPQNAAHIARICRALDGLPLGIELAAGWVRVLPLPAIAAEIEQNARFLIAQHQDVPQRHRSLWAVLSQTWNMLSSEEQHTLADLSIFESPFTRAAAEAVAAGEGDAAAITRLASLLDRSLLQRRPPQRFTLHPVLRQYAAEQRLQLDPGGATEDRHFAHFLRRVETALNAGDDRNRHLQQLATEYDDVRRALAWALENKQTQRGLALATGLYHFWYWRSHYREGSDWLEALLEASDGERLAPDLHGDALFALGVLLVQQNRLQAARQRLQQSLELRRRLDDRRGQAACLNSLGIIAWRSEHYVEATQLLEESLALRRQLDEEDLGPPLNNLGLVALAQGDFPRATSYFHELLHRERILGRKMGIAISLLNLAVAALQQEQYDDVRTYLQEATNLFRQLEDREGLAGCLETAAAMALAHDKALVAVRYSAAAAALRHAIGAPPSITERQRLEKTLAAAQSLLAPAAYQKAWQEGQSTSLDNLLNNLLA